MLSHNVKRWESHQHTMGYIRKWSGFEREPKPTNKPSKQVTLAKLHKPTFDLLNRVPECFAETGPVWGRLFHNISFLKLLFRFSILSL